MKPFLLILVFAFFINAGHAQRKSVSGLVRDSITLFTLPGAIITNGTTGKSVETNEKGFFRLDASVGDYIYALAENYHHDTLTFSYLFSDTISILLSPAGSILPNVIVRGNYTKYQLDSMDRKARFEQGNGKVMKTVGPHPEGGFGLTLNLDRVFKKPIRERSQNERFFNASEKKSYVDYRFSPHLVNYYTSLKGEQLRGFMNKYTPTYDWLRQNPTNEDVMYYINDKLKEYRILKSGK